MKYLLNNQETKRLKFRLLKDDDFDTWKELFYTNNIAIFLGLDPDLTPIELCEFWFNKVFERYEYDSGGMNVLINKETNEFVGQCGLLVQTVENVERLEIGYSILPKFWYKGYATEAAIKCKEYAFKNYFSDSLISVVHVDNIGSEKVAIKNGMIIEKELDDYDGSPVKVFSVFREVWESNLIH